MTYKLAQWLADRGVILVNAFCGLISAEWFDDEAAYRFRLLHDHMELEALREPEGPFVCDACNPVNKPN